MSVGADEAAGLPPADGSLLDPVLTTACPKAGVISVPYTAPEELVTVRSDPSPSKSGVSPSLRTSAFP